MKAVLTKTLSLALVLVLAAPFGIYSAYAGCGGCDKYKSEALSLGSDCAAANASTNASNMASPTPSATEGPSCKDLTAQFEAKWGQAGEHCQSFYTNEEAADADKNTATVYTATAVICAVACVWGQTAWGAWTVPVCMVSGVIAGINDIAQSSKVGSEMGMITGALAGIGGGAGVATWGKAFHNYGGTTQGGAGDAAEGASTDNNSSCYAFAFAAILAGIKFYGYSDNNSNASEACSKVQGFVAPGAYNNFNQVKAPTYAGTGGMSSGGGSTGNSGSQSGEKSFDGSNFPASVSAATAGGVHDKFFQLLPNRKDMPAGLEKLGLSLKDIDRKLSSGASPASILGGLPNMPTEVSKALKDAEDSLKGKKLQLMESAGPSTSGGGGGAAKGGGAMANPFGDLSNLLGQQEEKKAEEGKATLGFNKKFDTSADSDIWHTGFKGSIFQIVSGRIDKSRDKVSTLEWATPLNRAITGLPNNQNKLK